MKVDGNDDVIKEALRIQRAENKVSIQKKAVSSGTASGDSEVADQVNIGTSQALRNELDPEQILSERRKKVEELKQLYQAGALKPGSSDEQAAKIVAGMNDEIADLKYLTNEE